MLRSVVALFLLVAGCADASSDTPPMEGDATPPTVAPPTGEPTTDSPTPATPPPGTPAPGNTPDSPPSEPTPASPPGADDGADAGMAMRNDAGTPSALPDAGVDGDASIGVGRGSCCQAQDGPGCNNASLQVCVCELDPSCCTDQWTAACALLVTSKFCQDGVRECVCGDADGQWQQDQCCNTEWTDYCDTVGEQKCGAIPGCF